MILSHVKNVFGVAVSAGQLSEVIPCGSFAHLVALGCFEGNLGHVILEHIFPGALLDDYQVKYTTALASKRVLHLFYTQTHNQRSDKTSSRRICLLFVLCVASLFLGYFLMCTVDKHKGQSMVTQSKTINIVC